MWPMNFLKGESMKTRRLILRDTEVRDVLDKGTLEVRRAIKPPKIFATPRWEFENGHSGPGWYCCEDEYPEEGSLLCICPFGGPGDSRWIAECWRIGGGHAESTVSHIVELFSVSDVQMNHLHYRADEPERATDTHWRPSTQMPRWASRLTLEVVTVTVDMVRLEWVGGFKRVEGES